MIVRLRRRLFDKLSENPKGSRAATDEIDEVENVAAAIYAAMPRARTTTPD